MSVAEKYMKGIATGIAVPLIGTAAILGNTPTSEEVQEYQQLTNNKPDIVEKFEAKPSMNQETNDTKDAEIKISRVVNDVVNAHRNIKKTPQRLPDEKSVFSGNPPKGYGEDKIDLGKGFYADLSRIKPIDKNQYMDRLRQESAQRRENGHSNDQKNTAGRVHERGQQL